MLSQSQSQLDESATDSVDDVSHLTQQWINERNAPQLLPFEGGAVERILELLQAQTETLEDLNNLDESNDEFIRSVYALEMERIKFVLRSYFRARLSKIELNTLAILTNPEYRRNLSENELTYAERFNDITNENYKKSFLDEACPPSLQNLNDPETGT
ncbi:GINS complex subunit [Chytriomyces hyalinus]|nr:GINS complex subunit [Chytriomyces hyalinus]